VLVLGLLQSWLIVRPNRIAVRPRRRTLGIFPRRAKKSPRV